MLSQLIQCTDAQVCKIAEIAFDYLFGIINKSEAKQIMTNLGLDKEKLSIVNNGYVLRNCKYYIYAKTKNEKVKPSDYKIDDSDVIMLDRIASCLKINGCKPWSLKRLEINERVLVSKTLKDYIGRYISKKMTFLIKSYGVSRHDLEFELLVAALFALHKKYPYYESSLHAINTVKSTIIHKGIDLINHYTRKKNQRLKQNSDGTFEAVNVDCAVLQMLEAPQEFDLRYKDERSSLRSLQDRMNDKGALFISLARGDFNSDFSDYLGMNNVECAERNYSVYLKKIHRYLNVDESQSEKFFAKLRKQLI